MGIYTNTAGFGGYGTYSSPSYDTVEPFALSEHYNYHELGIIAATESAMNRDMFMQSIGIAEANALAQYGDENVFYESVSIKGIFQKIKMFFKKIIEKIQKIFHTFIAKMSSWFSSSKDFAKKYGKEITTKWGRIKNDLDFKGYKFRVILTKSGMATKQDVKEVYTGDPIWSKILTDASKETDVIESINNTCGTQWHDGNFNKNLSEEISKYRSDKFDDFKDYVRKQLVDDIANGSGVAFNMNGSGGYDQKEFTEELYKVLRGGEDSKEELSKSDIEKVYGGSITNLISFLTEYDKIKSNLEAQQKGLVEGIDKIIGAFDKAEKFEVKTASDESKKDAAHKDENKIIKNETLVAACVLCQDILGFIKEAEVQRFGAILQAQKEACSQAKEICVMTIGQSKKVTEESYDYGNSGDFGSFANGLIENTVIR